MFSTLHTILLFGFVSVTSLLVLFTTANRLRVRRVVLSWKAGPLRGWPIWPTVFLGMVLLLLAYTLLTSSRVHPSIFFGYLVGGVFWFVSVLLSSSVLITEYGIISSITRVDNAVAWGQMADYFEVPQDERSTFVFIYLDELGVRRRLELQVPSAQVVRFKQVVRAKLDARIAYGMQQAYGKKALEG